MKAPYIVILIVLPILLLVLTSSHKFNDYDKHMYIKTIEQHGAYSLKTANNWVWINMKHYSPEYQKTHPL